MKISLSETLTRHKFVLSDYRSVVPFAAMGKLVTTRPAMRPITNLYQTNSNKRQLNLLCYFYLCAWCSPAPYVGFHVQSWRKELLRWVGLAKIAC